MSGKNQTSQEQQGVLGVSVGSDMIHAALLRKQDGRVTVVARFLRQRLVQSQLAGLENVAAGLPGMKQKSDDPDYILEIGDGSAGDDVSQLDFGSLQKSVDKKGGTGTTPAAVVSGPPIAPQLREILQECATLGYAHPTITFCLTSPSVSYVELDATAESADGATDRKQLIDRLRAVRPDEKHDRVTFVPMVAESGRERHLAVIAEPGEPVAPALQIIREQHEALAPSEAFLDAEAPLFTTLVKHGLKPVRREYTALVRVGNDDTAVFFWEGDRLLNTERLRSVSAYDPPDVVCSRVLLQQDVLRIGDVGTVVVMTSGRQEPLLEAFRKRFPDATVESAHRVLEDLQIDLDSDPDVYKAGVTSAAISALRYLEQWDVTPEANLLAPRLQKAARKKGIFAWHNAVALLLLIGVSTFAFIQHQGKAETIEELRREFRENPPPTPLMNPAILQARVDSLTTLHRNYTHALNVLDSLLVGTDKWISTMERLSRATAATPRTWLDTAQPQSNTTLRITGRSLTRLAVVDLSRRLGGAIQQITYQDVGQQRVFSFEMIIPTPLELPRAAMYLRTEKPDANPAGPLEVHPARLSE